MLLLLYGVYLVFFGALCCQFWLKFQVHPERSALCGARTAACLQVPHCCLSAGAPRLAVLPSLSLLTSSPQGLPAGDSAVSVAVSPRALRRLWISALLAAWILVAAPQSSCLWSLVLGSAQDPRELCMLCKGGACGS